MFSHTTPDPPGTAGTGTFDASARGKSGSLPGLFSFFEFRQMREYRSDCTNACCNDPKYGCNNRRIIQQPS